MCSASLLEALHLPNADRRELQACCTSLNAVPQNASILQPMLPAHAAQLPRDIISVFLVGKIVDKKFAKAARNRTRFTITNSNPGKKHARASQKKIVISVETKRMSLAADYQ